MRKIIAGALALVAFASLAHAEPLKVAISQRGFWDSSFVEFAEAAGFFKEAGIEVEPFYTDGGAATLTTVLSGSADIGLSNGLLGVIGAYVKGAPVRVISAQMTGAGELYWYARAESGIKSLKDAAGKTVVIARTADVPQLANQTIRVNVANVEALKTKRETIEKFMRVYARAIDWAYQDPRAVEIFARNMKLALPIARKAVDEFYPKAGLQIGEIKGLDLTLKDALDYKYIPAPKTEQDIAGLFEILYRPEVK